MPLFVWVACAALGMSLPLLWWSLQSSSPSASKSARENLVAGREVSSYRAAVLERSGTERLLDPILHKLAGLGRRFLPTTWFDTIDDRLATAGLLGRITGEQVVGAKVLATLLAVLLLGLPAMQEPTPWSVGFALGTPLVAWFAPDILLGGRADRRVKTIERELPDVLDQLTISVEAGLGFEAAMARIGDKGNSVLSLEFARTLQDIKLGVNRVDALEDLAERTQSGDVRHFVLALRQAERMGVPLARTLRIQAEEMRTKRRLRAEEAALKLPVKLIFPLGLCIFPALFIVIVGPAFLQISRIF